MTSRTKAACTTEDVIAESTTRRATSRGTTGYHKIIRATMKIKTRERPRIASVLPISNLLFSFGPTITRKYNHTTSVTTTDAILDDVLATIATSRTTNTKTTGVLRPQNHQRQRVSFCAKPELHYILSRREISSKEYKAAWYSREELDSISAYCLKQIHSITNNSKNYYQGGNSSGEMFIIGSRNGGCTDVDEEEDACCIRGLESFTPTASIVKKMNRSSSVQAVLIEQNRQKEQVRNQDKVGCDYAHAEAIRMIYHGISASSQLWAQVVALKDRREVEDMMDDDESLLPREGFGCGCGFGGRSSCHVVARGRTSSSTNPSCTVPVKTTSCRLDATIPLDSDKAKHQIVMAIAA